jgi:hypothetical protein
MAGCWENKTLVVFLTSQDVGGLTVMASTETRTVPPVKLAPPPMAARASVVTPL